MEYLFGEAGELGWVMAKALLLYLTAVLGFRISERRTLAQLSPFDFVAAVAVGAIVGRIPNAHDASFLTGAATLLTVLAGHAAVTRLRLIPGARAVLVRTPRLLVSGGLVLAEEVRRSGLTPDDLASLLRQQGIGDLSAVRFAILEDRGQLSVIRNPPLPPTEGDLLVGIAPRP